MSVRVWESEVVEAGDRAPESGQRAAPVREPARAPVRAAALLRNAVLLYLALTVLTGLAYPGLVTIIAGLFFPHQASGSLVRHGGELIGSELLGQPFSAAGYFWGRPSATSPANNAGASSGSNLGPTHPALAQAVTERIAALRAADPGNTAPVPIDLVTASSSGLDPDISPAAAYYQAARVARARGLEEAAVRALVARSIEGRQFGVLGEPRVNVLALNLALDGSGVAGRGAR